MMTIPKTGLNLTGKKIRASLSLVVFIILAEAVHQEWQKGETVSLFAIFLLVVGPTLVWVAVGCALAHPYCDEL